MWLDRRAAGCDVCMPLLSARSKRLLLARSHIKFRERDAVHRVQSPEIRDEDGYLDAKDKIKITVISQDEVKSD